MNSKIDSLVSKLAAAYLKERQGDFVHLGIRIPLDAEILTLALQNNIVGGFLRLAPSPQQGMEECEYLIGRMMKDGQITPLGLTLINELNQRFCAEVRQMIAEGQDPEAALRADEAKRLKELN